MPRRLLPSCPGPIPSLAPTAAGAGLLVLGLHHHLSGGAGAAFLAGGALGLAALKLWRATHPHPDPSFRPPTILPDPPFSLFDAAPAQASISAIAASPLLAFMAHSASSAHVSCGPPRGGPARRAIVSYPHPPKTAHDTLKRLRATSAIQALAGGLFELLEACQIPHAPDAGHPSLEIADRRTFITLPLSFVNSPLVPLSATFDLHADRTPLCALLALLQSPHGPGCGPVWAFSFTAEAPEPPPTVFALCPPPPPPPFAGTIQVRAPHPATALAGVLLAIAAIERSKRRLYGALARADLIAITGPDAARLHIPTLQSQACRLLGVLEHPAAGI